MTMDTSILSRVPVACSGWLNVFKSGIKLLPQPITQSIAITCENPELPSRHEAQTNDAAY